LQQENKLRKNLRRDLVIFRVNSVRDKVKKKRKFGFDEVLSEIDG
jgi:hypothetical protein